MASLAAAAAEEVILQLLSVVAQVAVESRV
jgi:hypothetical protein